MRPPRTFEIQGYQRTPLPCVLYEHGDESEIAVVFPGAARSGNRLGGSPGRPDLHFTRELLNDHGLPVLEVWVGRRYGAGR